MDASGYFDYFNRSYRLGALSGGNSLDHLVGGDKQPRWHGQAERTLGDWSSN